MPSKVCQQFTRPDTSKSENIDKFTNKHQHRQSQIIKFQLLDEKAPISDEKAPISTYVNHQLEIRENLK